MTADLLPKYDDFMLPTLRALRDLGGSASIEEIQDRLTTTMGLLQEQLDLTYPASGALIAPDRMSWARSRMKPAGLIESAGRGVWVLTDLGRQAVDYAGSVSSGTIRDFRGAMQGRADKGLIITTGSFTADARKEATRDGAPAIDLIDGEALCSLLRDLKLGVAVKQIVNEEIVIDHSFLDTI